MRIYSEMKDVELVGICDTDRNRAESEAKRYGTTPYFDHKGLLKQELDAVSVVVPTQVILKLLLTLSMQAFICLLKNL